MKPRTSNCECDNLDIVFPRFDAGSLATRWKEMLVDNLNSVEDWKELYQWFKKSKTSYRFLFSLDNFKMKTYHPHKSFVGVYTVSGSGTDCRSVAL